MPLIHVSPVKNKEHGSGGEIHLPINQLSISVKFLVLKATWHGFRLAAETSEDEKVAEEKLCWPGSLPLSWSEKAE